MSYQEKKNIVNIIGTLLISGIYFWYILQSHDGTNMTTDELLRFWASSLLILIPVTIVSKIVIHIVFSIGNAIAKKEYEQEQKMDERDKLIELKSSRNAQFIFVFGFILSMGALAMGMSVNIMFAILICSGIVSEIFGNLSQLYFYKKGM